MYCTAVSMEPDNVIFIDKNSRECHEMDEQSLNGHD